jgi:hypothetical protein
MRGAQKPFQRPALDIASFGTNRAPSCSSSALFRPTWLPPMPPWPAGAGRRARCYDRAGELPQLRLHGDCHGGNVLWTDAGPISSTSTTAAWARPFRTCG